MDYHEQQEESETLYEAMFSRLVSDLPSNFSAQIKRDAQPDISLRDFVVEAWPIVEPARPLVWNWHMGAITEHLEAVTQREIRRLIINIPRRQSKSLLACVFWPAWGWTFRPWERWLFASYSMSFARRDAVKAKDVMRSTWYTHKWGHQFQLKKGDIQKHRYLNTMTGFRMSTSVGGGALGDGGDVRVVDDPIKPKDIKSETLREQVISWYQDTWAQSTDDAQSDAEVIIMQRLHERDLSGFVLSEIGGYDHLVLPMRYDPAMKSISSIGWTDPRTEKGELLNPQRFGLKEVDELEKKAGEDLVQFTQNPNPETGNILKQYWFGYWQFPGQNLPPVVVYDIDGNVIEIEPVDLPEDRMWDEIIQSWDMTFKGKKKNDFVAGLVFGRVSADKYLLDLVNKRMTFTKTCEAVMALSEDWPTALVKLVESKANGPAIVDHLRSIVDGLIEVEPQGGKVARMHAISPMCEAGNVYLPHPHLYDWVIPARKQLVGFPRVANDDIADAFSQALGRWLGVLSWTD